MPDLHDLYKVRFMLPVVARLLSMVVLGVVAWRCLVPRSRFRIVVDRNGVVEHKGIRTERDRRILESLQRTRFVEGRMVISGVVSPTGRFKLKFTGHASPELQQQLRSYLVNEI